MADDTYPAPACLAFGTEAAERLTDMFVGMGQATRIANGQVPAERAVFRKLHGVAHATFEPRPDLPERFATGIFAGPARAAWLRFSSDTAPTSPDLQTTVGVGIKLFGVGGPNALDEHGDTADLILQNYPVFFVADAKTMCDFTYAGVVLGDYPSYIAAHPRTREILDGMEKVESSVLTTRYWGILPFRCGEAVVKYRLDPVTPSAGIGNDAPDYLATDMASRLRGAEYRFRLMVQERTDPDAMPLDDATVEWPEHLSPFVHAADLVIPRQDVEARGQADYGQGLAYNIWRVPAVNAPHPDSSIAAVRRVVYAAGAELRHGANGQPLDDPRRPRPSAPPVKRRDDCVVKAVIYPPIGVARVGTSEDYFIGPEVTEPAPAAPGFYRDRKHRIKRQAARFRVYGVNMDGDIVRELTGDARDVEIEWSVRLANTKAAWYGFQIALDIPESAAAPPTTLRNAAVADRASLAITPKERTVSGRKDGPERFDDGRFMGDRVYLGEILTDKAGRLVVVGGHGKSSSADGSYAVTFANNEGWHDDVSDGPVDAVVKLDGVKLDVVPAWVVVAPPNYGPQRKSVRTMWDLMRDIAIKAGTLARPARPSFTGDILPIFQRLTGLQWVNAGFAAGFGWGGAFDLSSPAALERLSAPGVASAALRRSVVHQFRRFSVDSWSPVPWPWNYGDAMNVPAAQTPRQYTALTDTQLWALDCWAAGDFEADFRPDARPPAALDAVPLAEQGDMLTRAAMEFCLADAFHPGCEMTWPMRNAGLYMAPFRIKHAPRGWVDPAPGEVLTGDAIGVPDGPLGAQSPGGLTRWMAVPWQTDTASCRSGYDKTYDPYIPTFWPARVPNEVLTEENYSVVMDEGRPMADRLAAFADRAAWIAPLGTTGYTDQINNMVAHFDDLGIVELRDGPKDGAFPDRIEVEDRHKLITDVVPEADPAKLGRSSKPHRSVKPAHAAQPAGTARLQATGGPVPRDPKRVEDLASIEKVRRFPNGLPSGLVTGSSRLDRG